jgi:hypothetical protein
MSDDPESRSVNPWKVGAMLARAGRPLPTLEQLQRDWGFGTEEACLFTLGHIEVTKGHFPIDTRLSIERKFLKRSVRPFKES